jgi:allantoate deiminase
MPVDYDRIVRDISQINSFNATPSQGVTRLTFTPEYEEARQYLIQQMHEADLSVWCDSFGNLFARLEGSDPSLPAVMAGSHLDTVPCGGQFDGVVGVVAALETARRIREDGLRPNHSYLVTVFAEEEGARFGQVLVGSRALAGLLDREAVSALKDSDSVGYLEALAHASLRPRDSQVFGRNSIKCMLEIHIEQSVVLEQEGKIIGIVEAVAGIQQMSVEVRGIPNHAGATPMKRRKDALAGTASMITSIEGIALNRSGPRTVCTVGKIQCEPNISNVIPGYCHFTVDLRDTEASWLQEAASAVDATCRRIGQERGLDTTVSLKPRTEPVLLSSRIGQLTEKVALEKGLPHMWMPSGAVHDAAIMAQLVETSMVFVPSIVGRSHVPEENTSYEHIYQGIDVFSEVLLRLCECA